MVIESFNTSGDAIVLSRNSIKSFEVDDLNLNVKSFKVPNAFNSFIYKYVRPSKAKRSFDYASRLIECGISTPFPIAYFEESTASGLKRSFYISKHIDFDFEFRELIHKPWFENRTEILEKFTEFTFKLHENNINFLDHSPGNTLIVKTETDYEFYLIDLNRMKFETLNLDKRMHNFRRLWLSKAMIKIMSKTYAELYGKSYKETHALMLKHSRDFQLKIDKKKLRRSGRKMRFASKNPK
ncbi:lipopolysaccharide kinase InaA family protein [Winogradskyella litorisediminis]|uniref:Lipopolysaccharide kinase InaA family protein n=1 Tax=Winogradskyella litorisediminis TaxID=1156618 RepID=A0ABW3N6Z6_9FLAO